jgi:hypothetical protein
MLPEGTELPIHISPQVPVTGDKQTSPGMSKST